MLEKQPDLWGLAGAIIVSVLSGIISLASRIAKGHPLNIFWIVSEMGAAVLFGYLVYDAYPILVKYLPDWVTMPILIASCAHIGGRLFQWIEFKAKERFGIQLPDQ